ncbi:hypothetical protein [Silvibacterium sp.]|uniref:hypothetical protein n=1 Tax=Silvibacterium sp. TaxID=1964179 RepID=UPI0039E6A2DE
MTHWFASLRITGFLVFLAATAVFAVSEPQSLPAASLWTAQNVTHAYGFPEVHPNRKGTLTLGADSLSFVNASVEGSISRSAITAVSTGNDRVELWGTGGRILRMAIPEGGGLAAAAFMHHKVGMLTVEFRDTRGGTHYAVFDLPPAEAQQAVAAFTAAPRAVPASSSAGCGQQTVEAGSVLVDIPDWQAVEVPAAYKALVYEHVIDRLQHAKGVTRVYRGAEQLAACPQYRVQISVTSFKPGNQVVRASSGPVGMFTSATQIGFDAHFTDRSGRLDVEEKIRASVRTESESASVADKFAKALTKRYLEAVKQFAVSSPRLAAG